MAEAEDDGPAGVPEWVVTYGDMMSLLLTFFIMLVSMSQLKEEGRVRRMLDAIRKSFGATPGEAGVPGKSVQRTSAPNKRSSAGRRSKKGTKRSGRVDKGFGGEEVTVRRINHGVVVTLGGPVMFARFRADPSDRLKEETRRLAKILAKQTNLIVVRGHASPEPLPANSGFANEMQLSFARANAVANVLVASGIDPDRLRVSAVGAAEPKIRSRQLEQQAQNRRVDIFIIDAHSNPRAKRRPEGIALGSSSTSSL